MGNNEESKVVHQGGCGGNSALISTSRARNVSINLGSLGVIVEKSAPDFNLPVITLSTIVTDLTSSC